ncbi:MAG: DnaJ domain-containing protein [Halobacteriales archaeon]
MPDDFYDLLGLPRDATQEEVKRAYREKVRTYHPDLNDDPRAQAQFTALKKAYDTLGDPDERQDYDRLGHETYVAKRLEGLPSQEKWTTGTAESATESSMRTGARESATASTRTTGDDAERSNRTGTRSAGAAAAGTGGTSRAATDGSTRTGAGATARRRSRRRPRREPSGLHARLLRIWRIGFGWPLIFATDVLYVVGLELLVGANQSTVWSALEALATAGTDAEALGAVLRRPSDLGVLEFLTGSGYVEGVPAAGALLVLGALILPLVYGVVIRRTRRSYSAWNPTWLYVVATLAPLAGLGLAASGLARVGTDLFLFGALPLAAIVLLPLSAFVRPWLLDRLGR